MLNQPTSSPMITRMLGGRCCCCCCCCCCVCCCCCGCGCGSGTRCCCCAAVGMLAAIIAANEASAPSQMGLIVRCALKLGCPRRAGSLLPKSRAVSVDLGSVLEARRAMQVLVSL